MKFCTNCGNKLEENASVCLKCGKTIGEKKIVKKKKGLPTWAIILIVVGCVVLVPLLMVIVATFAFFSYVKDNNIDVKRYVDNYILSEGTIGDTLRAGDLSITLKDYALYDSIDEVNKELDGKKYLVFFIDVKNDGYENMHITNYDFTGYIDDYNVPIEKLFSTIEDKHELDVNLAPGKSANGYVAFIVDETWLSFELQYNSYDDENVLFRVSNEGESKLDA